MKIKMKALAAGPTGVFLAGQTYSSPADLTDMKARLFVENGYAEQVEEKAEKIETATAPAEVIEQAVKPRASARLRVRQEQRDE